IDRPGLGLMLAPEARVFQDERYLLVIEGEMFDVSPQAALADPGRLQTAYGLYTYVWFDGLERKTIIGTDRLGYSPLYYSSDGQLLRFSTSLSYLKSQLPAKTPDYAAWEELCVLGELLGDKTTVREIRRLDYGVAMCLSDGGISSRRFWKPEIPDTVDFDTYVRANNALLDEAMA